MKLSENTFGINQTTGVYSSFNRKINHLLGLIILVFFFGIVFYEKDFNFWHDALSSLGNLYPGHAESNFIGFVIILSGMLLCSVISLNISQGLKGTINSVPFRISALGFILLAAPCNQFDTIHSLGGALTIGSLWWFCSYNLWKIHIQNRSHNSLIYLIFLQLTVLPYAILYFPGLPVRQLAQKFAIIGLILVLKATAIELKRRFEN